MRQGCKIPLLLLILALLCQCKYSGTTTNGWAFSLQTEHTWSDCVDLHLSKISRWQENKVKDVLVESNEYCLSDTLLIHWSVCLYYAIYTQCMKQRLKLIEVLLLWMAFFVYCWIRLFVFFLFWWKDVRHGCDCEVEHETQIQCFSNLVLNRKKLITFYTWNNCHQQVGSTFYLKWHGLWVTFKHTIPEVRKIHGLPIRSRLWLRFHVWFFISVVLKKP